MKKETLFLRAVILIIGVAILAACLFFLPIMAREFIEYFKWRAVPTFVAMYTATIPVFYALYQTLRLLKYIDENKAFSELSITALKHIKFSAIAVSVLYIFNMPFLYAMAEFDDAPGIIIFGTIPVLAAFVVAVFAAVIQKLVNSAVEIKSENDLTV